MSRSTWQRTVMRWGVWNLVFRFWVKFHVHGWENVPGSGPVVIMGNHINMLDPVMMISLYPDRDIVPIAKMEAFDQPLMRYMVRNWDAIRINRNEADLLALKQALSLIEKGVVVMLYAEGHRSKTGLLPGQEGSAYIALKTKAIVVPTAIWGTEGFPLAWLNDFKRMHVHISFGKPFRFRHDGNKLPREHFRAMTDEAMYRIAELLPASLRGIYNDLSSATTRHLDFDLKWQPPRQQIPHFAPTSNSKE